MGTPENFRFDPNFEISRDPVDKNLDWFRSNRFFEPFFPLTRMEEPLRLSDDSRKDYFFPTLYGEVTSSVAIFLCDLSSARAVLKEHVGGESLEPARAVPTKSMVIFSSYHYEKVSGLGPYNEIAISVPVVEGSKINLPFVSLRNHQYFVLSMPVTTLENQERGRKIWGLPKVVEPIYHYVDGPDYVTEARAKSAQGYEPYLEFRVPWNAERKEEMTQSVHLMSMRNEKLCKATSRSSGVFAVEQHLDPITRNQSPSRLKITGNSPSALLLKSLKIEEHAFETRFGTNISSTFDLPKRAEISEN